MGKLYADTHIKQTQSYMKKIIDENDKICNPLITSKVHKFLTKQNSESLSYLWKIIKLSIKDIYKNDQDILKLIPTNVQFWNKGSYVMAIKKFIVYLVSNDDEYDINLEENQNNIIIWLRYIAETEGILRFSNSRYPNTIVPKHYRYRKPRKSQKNPAPIDLHESGTLINYKSIKLISLDDDAKIEQSMMDMWKKCWAVKDEMANNWFDKQFDIIVDKQSE